jgi:AcrR family transcriptional regulator
MRTTRTEEEFTAELADLLKREGITSMSVGDIAKRLFCSRRRLYEIAPTKDGLLLAVARQQFQDSLAIGFAAADAQSDPARSLVAYLDAGLRAAEHLSAAFLSDLQQSDEGRAMFDEYQFARSMGARKILEAGVRCGEFRPLNTDVVSEVLLGAASRLRKADFLRRAGLTIPDAFAQAYELVLEGLLVRPASMDHVNRPVKSRRGRSLAHSHKVKGSDLDAA